MSRITQAWHDGGEASRGVAEGAAGIIVSMIAPFIKLLAMVVDGVLIFFKATILGILGKIPKVGGDVADGLINAGNKMKLKKADVICNVIYGDGVVIPRKATWESDKTAFVTDNDETFYAKGIGYDPKRLNGKIPTVWALRASSEITEPLESAIATARQLGRFQEFTRAGGQPDVAVDIDPNGYDYGPGVGRPREQAMTDGGVAAGHQRRTPGGGAPETGDYTGTVVSFRDAFEMFGGKIDQEEMQQQETRGKLAALNMQDWGNNWKYILALLAAFALGLLGPAIASRIAGSASGVISGGLNIGLTIVPALPGVVG